MKGAIFNVGPLTNDYFGPHTYADVLFPLIKELAKEHHVRLTWVGIELENNIDNSAVRSLGIRKYQETLMGDHINIMSPVNEGYIKRATKSWDLMDANDYDFLLCQPRPPFCEIENQILLTLIDKFLDAGKAVFVWEQDMFTDNFTDRQRKEVVLLHPAEVKTGKFEQEHHFPFFTYNRTMDMSNERELDFTFIGNVYSRNPQALQFFAPMNDAEFKKTVFGSWTQDETRKEFAAQFTNFDFAGSTEHWAAIPLMQRAKATLHIVPDFARDRGLMTARVFTSHMAECLCFCDAGIVGAEKYFPPELIVKNGQEIVERWDEVQENRDDILGRRELLMKDFTVQNAALHFMELCNKYVK